MPEPPPRPAAAFSPSRELGSRPAAVVGAELPAEDAAGPDPGRSLSAVVSIHVVGRDTKSWNPIINDCPDAMLVLGEFVSAVPGSLALAGFAWSPLARSAEIAGVAGTISRPGCSMHCDALPLRPGVSRSPWSISTTFAAALAAALAARFVAAVAAAAVIFA